MDEYEPITLEEAETEIANDVQEAVDFMHSEFAEVWEKAQEYYNGESSVPKVENRSQVTSTNVRDAIRNLRPSLLRIFLHADTIVQYIPNTISQQTLAHNQSIYINQLFFRVGGYKALYNGIQNAALKKNGIIMCWWDDNPTTEEIDLTNLTIADLQTINSAPHLSILSAEQNGQAIPGPEGVMPLYDAKIAKMNYNGGIRVDSVPLAEFFIDENATCIKDAHIHGTRRSTPIHEALAMGLPYEELEDLDDMDVETFVNAGESEARRGYIKSRQQGKDTKDPMMKKVLITCAYRKIDLEGTGVPQLYKFYLGGTGYKYLYHEKVRRSPFASICLDFEPDTFWGKSIFDILQQDQDTMTSLLRATCDNAHMANNRRLAVHERLVNMDDVLNPAIGAPIRFSAPGMIQEIGVQSTVATMLPLLQYLQQSSEVRVGVTNAAVGLDNDALQSTTRDAALNTIQLSQGQIEVMARNLAEGISEVFSLLLDLSLENMDPKQMMIMQGAYTPVDITQFDPSMEMKPNVGLGTGQAEQKLAGLGFIMSEQKEIIAQYGPNNPIAPVQALYNTYEDIAKLHGIHNISRYFAPLTPQSMQQIDQIMTAKAESAPMDPSKAMVQIEQTKAQLRAQEKQLEFALQQRDKAVDRQIRALEFAANDDLERDRMVQQLFGANAQPNSGTGVKGPVDVEKVMRAQASNRTDPYQIPRVAAE